MERNASASSSGPSSNALSLIQLERTPLRLLPQVSRFVGRDVWIKHDDRVHPVYGGNKARKLARILPQAREEKYTALITMGAAGSHHALACALHGSAAGFSVHVLLAPQRYTAHAEATLRATQRYATVHIAQKSSAIPLQLLRVATQLRWQQQRPLIVALGGSTPSGALAFFDAALELKEQLTELGPHKAPTSVFVPVGSGGTYAGLFAGVRYHGVPCRVVGVEVAGAARFSFPWVRWLTRTVLERQPTVRNRTLGLPRAEDYTIESNFSGEGYGIPTPEGMRAQELFDRDSVTLEPTYTAKTAAALLAHASHSPRGSSFLFWHTLSAAAPDAAHHPLDPSLEALLLR